MFMLEDFQMFDINIECRDNVLHCTDLYKCSGCKNEIERRK